MSIIRTSHNRENPYVQLNRESLNDTDVSWAAKGLWAYLISKSDNWNVSVPNLVNNFKKQKRGCGETAIYALLKELVETGYCIKIRHKDSKGKFTTYEYIILEERGLKETLPNPVKPEMDPLPVKPDVVKRDLTKEEILPLKKKEEEEGATLTKSPKKANESKPPKQSSKKSNPSTSGGGLTPDGDRLYKMLCKDPHYNWLSNGDKWDIIEEFGDEIAFLVINSFFSKYNSLEKNVIPPRIGSMRSVVWTECKKEIKRRDNGKI